jgi:hypothetical protein
VGIENQIGDAGAHALGTALEFNRTLVILDVTGACPTAA